MFTEAKLRKDINGKYGILESFSVYSYGGNRRFRALVGVNIVFQDDGVENYKASNPHIVFEHEFTPIQERVDVTVEQYVKAKKPIYSLLTENKLIVGIEVNSRKGDGKVVVYDPTPFLETNSLLLRPSKYTLSRKVEKELVKLLRTSNGDRSRFLEDRITLYVGTDLDENNEGGEI